MPPEEADALFGACDAEGAGVMSYTALETCLSRQKGFTDAPPTPEVSGEAPREAPREAEAEAHAEAEALRNKLDDYRASLQLEERQGREERDKYNRLVVELRRVTKLLEQQQGSAGSGTEAL